MRRFIVGFFAIIGALVVLVIVAGIGIAVYGSAGARCVSPTTPCSRSTSAPGSPTRAPSDALSQFLFPGRPPLKDVLDAIEKAGGDARVKGLIARIGDGEMGLAQAQELRDAIAAFRAKGKRAVAYSDSFGEFSSGTRSYYLASAFDDIWLQPHGLVGIDRPARRGAVLPRHARSSGRRAALRPSLGIQVRDRSLHRKDHDRGGPRAAHRAARFDLWPDRARHRRRPQARPRRGARARGSRAAPGAGGARRASHRPYRLQRRGDGGARRGSRRRQAGAAAVALSRRGRAAASERADHRAHLCHGRDLAQRQRRGPASGQ